MVKVGSADIERVRTTVTALVEEHHLPGVAVGVVSGEELVYAEGFGYADIESKRPQEPGRRQRIGSITKTMTALCTMTLVDEGRLSLDDRAVDLLPDVTFHGPAESLTVRHLLSHTGGIGEVPMPEDLPDLDQTLWSDRPDDTRVPDAFPQGLTIEVPPGGKWAYANHGFALLGEIVMRREGAKQLDELFRRRIFGPLGMTNTDCLDQPHQDLTTGYHRPPTEDMRELLARVGREPPEEETVDGHNIRGRYQYIKGLAGRSSGGVQSTIHDMARYASALLRRGAGIVRPETFDLMLAPQWCPDDRLTSIGLSFFREWRFGRRAFGHGGGVSGGWNTHLTVIPQHDLAVLTHLNLNYHKFGQVDDRILQAVLDAPNPALADQPLDPDIVASAPGVYEAPNPGPLTNFRVATGTGRLQVSARDGELWLRARRGPWKQGVRMRPADPKDPTFFYLDTGEVEAPRIVLVRDGSGAVQALRVAPLAAIEMVRNDAIQPWA